MFDPTGTSGSIHINGSLVLSTLPGPGYIINAKLVLPSSSTTTRISSTCDTAGAPLMTWHRRYGHIAPSTILEIEKKDVVNGLKLSDCKVEDCEACILSKSPRSPFSPTSTPAPRPLHQVFIDLGFVESPDSEGRITYLAIVDQFSTAKWSFPLTGKTASEFVGIFVDWRTQVELITGHKVKIVRSDNGPEFKNAAFASVCREFGILHELTAPYTPEQNSNIERLNVSLLNLVGAMLKDADLPKLFWSFALSVATHVSNHTVHARLGNKSAYEVIMNKKPSVAHLRPFGAIGFAHIDKSTRTKLDDRATRGIFVGYDSEYNYVLWLEDKKRTLVARHVVFGIDERSSLEVTLPLDYPSPPTTPTSIDDATDDQQVSQNDNRPPPPPDDSTSSKKWDYVPVVVGKNPGKFENVVLNNIIGGIDRPRPRQAHFVSSTRDKETIFVRLAVVNDSELPPLDAPNIVKPAFHSRDTWEEDSIFVGVSLPDTPRNYAKAMSSPDKKHWQQAITTKWNAFDSHGVLKLAKLPSGSQALGTTWVFIRKTDSKNVTIRYKACLVAQGLGQRPGIGVNETFAPVA